MNTEQIPSKALVRLLVGHTSTLLQKPTEDGRTHQWTVFIRPTGNTPFTDRSFIRSVIFHLHTSYKKPNRQVKVPPYEITETGYGSFTLPIEIYFTGSQREYVVNYELILSLNKYSEYALEQKIELKNPTRSFLDLIPIYCPRKPKQDKDSNKAVKSARTVNNPTQSISPDNKNSTMTNNKAPDNKNSTMTSNKAPDNDRIQSNAPPRKPMLPKNDLFMNSLIGTQQTKSLKIPKINKGEEKTTNAGKKDDKEAISPTTSTASNLKPDKELNTEKQKKQPAILPQKDSNDEKTPKSTAHRNSPTEKLSHKSNKHKNKEKEKNSQTIGENHEGKLEKSKDLNKKLADKPSSSSVPSEEKKLLPAKRKSSNSIVAADAEEKLKKKKYATSNEQKLTSPEQPLDDKAIKNSKKHKHSRRNEDESPADVVTTEKSSTHISILPLPNSTSKKKKSKKSSNEPNNIPCAKEGTITESLNDGFSQNESGVAKMSETKIESSKTKETSSTLSVPPSIAICPESQHISAANSCQNEFSRVDANTPDNSHEKNVDNKSAYPFEQGSQSPNILSSSADDSLQGSRESEAGKTAYGESPNFSIRPSSSSEEFFDSKVKRELDERFLETASLQTEKMQRLQKMINAAQLDSDLLYRCCDILIENDHQVIKMDTQNMRLGFALEDLSETTITLLENALLPAIRT